MSILLGKRLLCMGSRSKSRIEEGDQILPLACSLLFALGIGYGSYDRYSTSTPLYACSWKTNFQLLIFRISLVLFGSGDMVRFSAYPVSPHSYRLSAQQL
jgi:hypothetical protein